MEATGEIPLWTTTGVVQNVGRLECVILLPCFCVLRAIPDAINIQNSRAANPQITLLPSQPANASGCVGTYYKWDVGSLCKTYPFAIHDPTSSHAPGYTLLSVDFVSSIIHVRSARCHGSWTNSARCIACTDLDSDIEIVENWALQSFGKKSTGRLNHLQLEEKINLKETKLLGLFETSQKRNAEYKNLFDLTAENDVPGLPRLISNSKTLGWGVSKTADMTVKAIKGEYHAKNCTEFNMDLAVLIYELGGGAALYALNKSPFMLPSRHTIADIRRQYSLRITVGDVKISDILDNIEILFGDIECGDYGRVGITLSQDEIAGDGRLCYLEDTDEIAGLCEHATSRLKTFKMGSDLTVVEDVVKAIRADEIHIGKEFSVAAFSRHAPTDYGAKPVLLMPTCKKGSWQSSAEILQKLIWAWKISPFGEAKHDLLQTIASDGDGRRRAALYLVCMHRLLGPDDPLYKFLSELAGLNLYTGICTLLCSKEGMLVNDVIINKTLIAQWLEKLSGYDWSDESIHALLNPKDPQDVPRAVTLLCLIDDLRHLDTAELTPSERNTHRALSLLGEVFHALLEPFINPTLSLSEQVIHLVKFAHLACALFIKNEGDFMSHQLYGDLQCMVKNAIFKIAHSKVLNPALKVFLCLLGDDVLETLFGRSRMIGRHSPNMAVDELRQRFGSALRMDQIFRKYLHLERRARRLKLVRSRDVDHISPAQCTGELTAASCDLLACWLEAVAAAKAILAFYGCDVDFAALFARAGFDLMRPKGGKYPGVSKEVDRSLVDVYTSSEPSNGAKDSPSDAQVANGKILGFDGRAALEAERATAAENTSSTTADSEPDRHSIWIKLTEDGQKLAHKKTVLRTFMDPTFDINDGKSHDRLLRLRQWLFATLVSFNTSTVSLAILQCTGIKIVNTHPITYLEAAPTAEISLPDSRYEITGQILSLVPFVPSSDPTGNISWAWAAQFVAFESAKAKQASPTDAPARMRHLSITVNGRLVLPLLLKDLKQSTLEEILNVQVLNEENSDLQKTWVFSNAQLDEMTATLRGRVQDDEVRLKIPVYGPVKEGRYPYEATMTDRKLYQTLQKLSHCLASIKAPAPKDQRRPCNICGKKVAAPDRQNHMGKHILLSLQGVQDPSLLAEVEKNYPCGFCGQTSSPDGCGVGIASGKATSSCSEAYAFQITAASKSSATKPCTNVPIRCSLCTEIHWKYNFPRHLKDKHPSWEVTMPEESRDEFSAKISVTKMRNTDLVLSMQW
ncbi:hypothetical protein C8J57DRAFT_1078413 [Mycena rebaudengoi]|nr:hypothetical protein C8J57DRAFT_1078413 [Mycena rebaudengoi]